MNSPWPFAIWGTDLIGPLSTVQGGYKYAIVAVDYFIKLAKAKELAQITNSKVQYFTWDNIIYRFRVP